ncbi:MULTISPECIES: hypothetical protein [Sorangium]|uniref:hypothetical protein n=1 Tax=Sorangium TaxID=39643 RepID=UPI00101A9D1F|nr:MULTISPECIES: hypothetical protein [Sorangium]
MKHLVPLTTSAFVAACQLTHMAQAAETFPHEMIVECTTVGTTWDGARSSCYSDWETYTVPPGYIIVESSYKENRVSENGSENWIEHEWADPIEIIPGTGITAPRTIRVRVHALGPSGRFDPGRRGWTNVRIELNYIKYPE